MKGRMTSAAAPLVQLFRNSHYLLTARLTPYAEHESISKSTNMNQREVDKNQSMTVLCTRSCAPTSSQWPHNCTLFEAPQRTVATQLRARLAHTRCVLRWAPGSHC